MYPNAAAGLQRGIALLDRARVLVEDEYRLTQGNLPLHWAMVTRAKIDLAADGHSATLTSGGHLSGKRGGHRIRDADRPRRTPPELLQLRFHADYRLHSGPAVPNR